MSVRARGDCRRGQLGEGHAEGSLARETDGLTILHCTYSKERLVMLRHALSDETDEDDGPFLSPCTLLD